MPMWYINRRDQSKPSVNVVVGRGAPLLLRENTERYDKWSTVIPMRQGENIEGVDRKNKYRKNTS